ncbi:MAG: DsrE family protein [Myxococcaceae bacterium]|nr:DsrE family protein [Myxococcaceae bacterium]
MSKFLFIESQDPLEDRGAEAYLGYALELARQKHPVTVFLVENAALAARRGAQVPVRDALREAGATLQVDELALRERGIGAERLAPGVQQGTIDQLVDLVADPETRAIWH